MDNSLKEKLNFSIYWVVFLTILFFLIGAYLKSDGNKFDQVKFYELLKDSVSFGVALSAPFLVYIFFTDWRKEHVEKANEIKINQLYEVLESAFNINIDLFVKIGCVRFESPSVELEVLTVLSLKVDRLLQEAGDILDDLDGGDEKLLTYKSRVDEVCSSIKVMQKTTTDIVAANMESKEDQKYRNNYIHHIYETQELLFKLKCLKKELKIKAV